jgi:rhamnulokinase
MPSTTVLALDLGASSGRLVAASLDSKGMKLEEVHRFPNGIQELNGRLVWDLPALWTEVKRGLAMAAKLKPVSLGVDTWGVDYGLIDGDGQLLGLPFAYRDGRTAGALKAFAARGMTFDEIYARTGIQDMSFNTLYQRWSDGRLRPAQNRAVKHLLLMPDLFNFLLTGVAANEATIASTTAMLNARTRAWDRALLRRLGVSARGLGPIVQPGTRMGPLRAELAEETGLESLQVYTVAGHDTASAFLAAPLANPRSAILSCGTWALLGRELTHPILTPDAREKGFTNEGGANGTTRFLTNLNGTYLLQELRKEHPGLAFPELIAQAKAAECAPFRVSPNDPSLNAPHSMSQAIADACESAGQGRPRNLGERAQAVYSGLVEAWREKIADLEILTGEAVPAIHLVGGGSQDAYLCQRAADACQRPVIAGPVEATALGNALVQLQALGRVNNIRETIRAAFKVVTYPPAKAIRC